MTLREEEVRKRDQFQMALFSLRYKIHRRDKMTCVESFGMAIVETSDPAVEEMLKRTPTAIEDWRTLKREQAELNNALAKERKEKNDGREISAGSDCPAGDGTADFDDED